MQNICYEWAIIFIFFAAFYNPSFGTENINLYVYIYEIINISKIKYYEFIHLIFLYFKYYSFIYLKKYIILLYKFVLFI